MTRSEHSADDSSSMDANPAMLAGDSDGGDDARNGVDGAVGTGRVGVGVNGENGAGTDDGA